MEKITLNITRGNIYKVVPLFIEYLQAQVSFLPVERAEEFDPIVGSRVLAMALKENSELTFDRAVREKEKRSLTFTEALEWVLIDAGSRDSWYSSAVQGGKDYS